MFHHPSHSANTPLPCYRILYSTLFLATGHKLRAVRKASLQEFSDPPQVGQHSPVLRETKHRKKVKIECFQIFCIMSCPSLRKVYLRNALECCKPQTCFLHLVCFFPTVTDKPKTIKLCGRGKKCIQLSFKKSLLF